LFDNLSPIGWVKQSQFLSFEITPMDWMMTSFEVEHMALASQQLVSQRDTVSIFQAVVFLG